MVTYFLGSVNNFIMLPGRVSYFINLALERSAGNFKSHKPQESLSSHSTPPRDRSLGCLTPPSVATIFYFAAALGNRSAATHHAAWLPVETSHYHESQPLVTDCRNQQFAGTSVNNALRSARIIVTNHPHTHQLVVSTFPGFLFVLQATETTMHTTKLHFPFPRIPHLSLHGDNPQIKHQLEVFTCGVGGQL
jgi:hypothetical protein